MNHDISELRSQMVAIVNEAASQSDQYYVELLTLECGAGNVSVEPVGRVPRKISEWSRTEDERLAVWNAYDQAKVRAEHMDMTDNSVVAIRAALDEVIRLENASPVRAADAPIFAVIAREKVLALSQQWLIQP